ncbi:MAG: c-type cytochrome [Anaerolineales bacterium]|nr:c-type cytochrome [Anaerolineales bacterium]
MNEETKKKINQKYEHKLAHGERFWPDSLYKDAVVALGIFLLLILLATFVGVPGEPKADPSDATYVPRPEWYFLFLFKFLAIYGQIPVLGRIEWIAAVLIPGIFLIVLTLLPFIEKKPDRHYSKRVLPISVMGIFVVSVVTLTLIADHPLKWDAQYRLTSLLQVISGLIIPTAAYLLLFLFSFLLKDQRASQGMVLTAGLSGVLMVGLTASVLFLAPVPEVEEVFVANTLPDRVVAGQDLYSIHCVECHGDDGSVTVIEGVEGLDGTVTSPISGMDVLYTFTDATIANIITYGQQDLGMPPFGKAAGGELSVSEIDYIVTFMRYSWDDRFEMPEIPELFPPLAEGEVPSYEVHIAPIAKRFCISCHREGKDNNNYLMTSYDEIIHSGDSAPNLVAGDAESILLKVIQEQNILDENGEEIIGVMPPKSVLKPDVVDVWVRWVMAGMPETVDGAAALSDIVEPVER